MSTKRHKFCFLCCFRITVHGFPLNTVVAFSSICYYLISPLPSLWSNYCNFQNAKCIKDCDKAVERGRELRSDFKMVARALTRKGTALAKMARCSKDYERAIETFQKALTEHRNPDTLKKLNDAEKAKKDLEQQEYFDPKLAEEEREKGSHSLLIFSCWSFLWMALN